MKFIATDIRLQEVPGEVSLAFHVSECPHACKGCHSPQLWTNFGQQLDLQALHASLAKYASLVTCVLFMGGDHDTRGLVDLLDAVRALDLKTALYTGSELAQLSPEVLARLSYVKVGRWHEDLGGLDSPTTNQRLLNLASGEDITYKLRRGSCS